MIEAHFRGWCLAMDHYADDDAAGFAGVMEFWTGLLACAVMKQIGRGSSPGRDICTGAT